MFPPSKLHIVAIVPKYVTYILSQLWDGMYFCPRFIANSWAKPIKPSKLKFYGIGKTSVARVLPTLDISARLSESLKVDEFPPMPLCEFPPTEGKWAGIGTWGRTIFGKVAEWNKVLVPPTTFGRGTRRDTRLYRARNIGMYVENIARLYLAYGGK